MPQHGGLVRLPQHGGLVCLPQHGGLVRLPQHSLSLHSRAGQLKPAFSRGMNIIITSSMNSVKVIMGLKVYRGLGGAQPSCTRHCNELTNDVGLHE